MAKEFSPWEGALDQKLAGQTCLGVITDVDVANRSCRVKTIGLKGRTDDLELSDVQFISMCVPTSEYGAEDTVIPVVGAMCVLTFINNQPYITGYYRPVKTTDDLNRVPDERDPTQYEESLINTGDRIIKNIGKNKIILRSGGSVEIESNPLCRTYWLPSDLKVSTVCNMHQLEVAGGFTFWGKLPSRNKSVSHSFIYDAPTPTNALDLQIGTPEDDTQFITATLGQVDQNTYTIPLPTFSLNVAPDGTTQLVVGTEDKKTTVVIDGAAGGVSVDTQGAVSVKSAKEITIEGSGGAKAKLAEGKIALGSSAAELCALLDETLSAIQALTVPTTMGPSAVPINSAQFSSIQQKLAQIKGTL